VLRTGQVVAAACSVAFSSLSPFDPTRPAKTEAQTKPTSVSSRTAPVSLCRHVLLPSILREKTLEHGLGVFPAELCACTCT
jgi:hypothetical protein